MEIIGWGTKDANVTTTKDENKVANLNIVLEHDFNPKDKLQSSITTNYVQCVY